MKRKIDRKKIAQILSVYLLALVAAVICGSGHSTKAAAEPPTREETIEQVTGASAEAANAAVK